MKYVGSSSEYHPVLQIFNWALMKSEEGPTYIKHKKRFHTNLSTAIIFFGMHIKVNK